MTIIRIPFLVSLLLIGCASNQDIGYMTDTQVNPTTGKMETTEYSPYYEYEFTTADKNLMARLVITLGPERVPPGYKHTGTFAKNLKSSYRNGIVDWVSEIYFFNLSNSLIEVTPTYVKVGNDSEVFSRTLDIPPSGYKISDPLISLHSVYGTKSEVTFKFEYKGKEHKVEGTAKRMTTNEINSKY